MSSNVQSKNRSGEPSAAKQVASDKIHEYGNHYVTEPARDLGSVLRDYAHDKPDVAALWCFAFGLMVGWKLRG